MKFLLKKKSEPTQSVVPYVLVHPARARRVTLKVEHPNQVIIYAPKKTPIELINKFVNDHQQWIQNQLERLKISHNLIESDNQIMIFGKKLSKISSNNKTQEQGVYTSNNTLIINYPSSTSAKTIEKEVRLFLKKAARTYLYKQTPNLANIMGLTYNSLTLREQKSRWGSCSGKDNLNLNWRLVHYPPAVINYVIIHELAHLVHHDHSINFWNLVAKYDPEYKIHRKYLKKYGVTSYD